MDKKWALKVDYDTVLSTPECTDTEKVDDDAGVSMKSLMKSVSMPFSFGSKLSDKKQVEEGESTKSLLSLSGHHSAFKPT